MDECEFKAECVKAWKDSTIHRCDDDYIAKCSQRKFALLVRDPKQYANREELEKEIDKLFSAKDDPDYMEILNIIRTHGKEE